MMTATLLAFLAEKVLGVTPAGVPNVAMVPGIGKTWFLVWIVRLHLQQSGASAGHVPARPAPCYVVTLCGGASGFSRSWAAATSCQYATGLRAKAM